VDGIIRNLLSAANHCIPTVSLYFLSFTSSFLFQATKVSAAAGKMEITREKAHLGTVAPHGAHSAILVHIICSLGLASTSQGWKSRFCEAELVCLRGAHLRSLHGEMLDQKLSVAHVLSGPTDCTTVSFIALHP
jgi:hypothetical protein